MGRYGRLTLEKNPVHGLVLHTTDVAVLEEVLRSKKIMPLVGQRIAIHAAAKAATPPRTTEAGTP